jgi:DNA-3-methyladenine glycosylase II
MDEKIQEALRHLAKKDKAMKKVIPHVAHQVRITPTEDYFGCLVNNIICQLISSKAADTVVARLDAYIGGRMEPAVLADIDTETYRTFGIGPQKSGYIRGLAETFMAEPERFKHLHKFEDKEIVKALSSLKGIGKWTAEMFLIFGLGRLDVFAPDDLGLRNAMIRLYPQLGEEPSKKELVAKAHDWAPYRSVASIVLWRSLSLVD